MNHSKKTICFVLCLTAFSLKSLCLSPYERLIELMNESDQKFEQIRNDYKNKTQELYYQYLQKYYLLKLDHAKGIISSNDFHRSVCELNLNHIRKLAELQAQEDTAHKQIFDQSIQKRKSLLPS